MLSTNPYIFFPIHIISGIITVWLWLAFIYGVKFDIAISHEHDPKDIYFMHDVWKANWKETFFFILTGLFFGAFGIIGLGSTTLVMTAVIIAARIGNKHKPPQLRSRIPIEPFWHFREYVILHKTAQNKTQKRQAQLKIMKCRNIFRDITLKIFPKMSYTVVIDSEN